MYILIGEQPCIRYCAYIFSRFHKEISCRPHPLYPPSAPCADDEADDTDPIKLLTYPGEWAGPFIGDKSGIGTIPVCSLTFTPAGVDEGVLGTGLVLIVSLEEYEQLSTKELTLSSFGNGFNIRLIGKDWHVDITVQAEAIFVTYSIKELKGFFHKEFAAVNIETFSRELTDFLEEYPVTANPQSRAIQEALKMVEWIIAFWADPNNAALATLQPSDMVH